MTAGNDPQQGQDPTWPVPGQPPGHQQPPWAQPPSHQYPQNPQYPQYPPGQYQQPPAPPPWGMRAMAPPKPGSLPLAPNDLSKTLSAVFSSVKNVLRAVWPGFIPLVACAGLLAVLASVAIVGPAQREVTPSSAAVLTALAVGFPLYLLQIAISMLVLFATVRATADAVLGLRSDVSATWRTSVRSLPRAAALFLLGVLASLLLLGALIGLIYLGYTEHWAMFALMLVLCILVIMAAALVGWLKLSLTIPAMVLEGHEPIGDGEPLNTRPAGLFASVGRSWRLTKGRAWRTLLIVWLMSFISGAVVSVISPAIQVPVSLLTAGGSDTVSAIGFGISATLASTLSILPTLLTTITVTVLYADARIRDEQLAPAVLGFLARRDPPNPWTVGPPPAMGDAPPWADIGNPAVDPGPYGQSAVRPD